MCTAIRFQKHHCYFGRTLDIGKSHAEEVVISPRRFPFSFRNGKTLSAHFAVIGTAFVQEGYPLYYDACNEKGLAMAGLNFVGNAAFFKENPEKDNLAQFELIPWILMQCADAEEAKLLLSRCNLTDTPFSAELPTAQLHWIICDRREAITVEFVRDGLKIYPNPAGVLTNNPPFPMQLFRLNDFMGLSVRAPKNSFCKELPLAPYSFGMGGLGLPGDTSSQSRFVRAAFHLANARCEEEEEACVGQFFHIMDTVAVPFGSCDMGGGEFEITRYTSCCNLEKGIYYYTTYGNRQISAVELRRENLDGEELKRFPFVSGERIFYQNGEKEGENRKK